jgi:hypothetical protein
MGDPVFDLTEIERCFERQDELLETVVTDADTVVGRCVERLLADVSEVRPPNAVITFLRNGRDYYLMQVGRDEQDRDVERPTVARLRVLEPLSVSRSRRNVGSAVARRSVGRDGIATYGITVPVHVHGRPDLCPAYVHLILLNKVLSRLGQEPRKTAVDMTWIG